IREEHHCQCRDQHVLGWHVSSVYMSNDRDWNRTGLACEVTVGCAMVGQVLCGGAVPGVRIIQSRGRNNRSPHSASSPCCRGAWGFCLRLCLPGVRYSFYYGRIADHPFRPKARRGVASVPTPCKWQPLAAEQLREAVLMRIED